MSDWEERIISILLDGFTDQPLLWTFRLDVSFPPATGFCIRQVASTMVWWYLIE